MSWPFLAIVSGKIFARVLLNRLTKRLEQSLLLESQFGFRASRGTVDMVFAVRQLLEKCQEQHQNLYTIFGQRHLIPSVEKGCGNSWLSMAALQLLSP